MALDGEIRLYKCGDGNVPMFITACKPENNRGSLGQGKCMCRIWHRGMRSAWIGMPRDGGCRLRLPAEDVGSGTDKR